MAVPWLDGVAKIKKIAMGECIYWWKIVAGRGGHHGGAWQA